MPLSMVEIGQQGQIKKINGRDETKRFLEQLGFIAGEQVTVVSKLAGCMICSIKGTRVALDRSMATRIMV